MILCLVPFTFSVAYSIAHFIPISYPSPTHSLLISYPFHTHSIPIQLPSLNPATKMNHTTTILSRLEVTRLDCLTGGGGGGLGAGLLAYLAFGGGRMK